MGARRPEPRARRVHSHLPVEQVPDQRWSLLCKPFSPLPFLPCLKECCDYFGQRKIPAHLTSPVCVLLSRSSFQLGVFCISGSAAVGHHHCRPLLARALLAIIEGCFRCLLPLPPQTSAQILFSSQVERAA